MLGSWVGGLLEFFLLVSLESSEPSFSVKADKRMRTEVVETTPTLTGKLKTLIT